MKKLTRYYSLYEKQNGKWVRISDASYPKAVAVRYFQNALLNAAFSGITRELRWTGKY